MPRDLVELSAPTTIILPSVDILTDDPYLLFAARAAGNISCCSVKVSPEREKT